MQVPDSSLKDDFKRFAILQEKADWPNTISEAHAAFHDLKFYWKGDGDEEQDDTTEPLLKTLEKLAMCAGPADDPNN